MTRDLSTISRVLDDPRNNDIIYKKSIVRDIFEKDPDLKEVLGQLDKIPLNKYKDKNNPTEAELKERARIIDYNEKVSHPQIIDFLKVNEIQKEVLNFIMYDMSDDRQSYTSELIKYQKLTVMCLVHEDDMETEYDGINRVDLLSYIVKDLLCGTNRTGLHLTLASDNFSITDTKYYARTLEFITKVPNTSNFRNGMVTNLYG